jgi:predicted patatin/cPLA2 family phospholipase
VALAVEGGAMRGVVSAGMVSALEELGFGDVFDAVYGSSAGAVNAAYFLAGQARLGTSIYYEDINNRRFINLGRAAMGRPIVDMGFLLDDVAVHHKRLDVERLLASATPLWVLATDVETGQRATLNGFSDSRGLREALRAGATMPVMAGPPRVYGGRRYLDASLSEPIPVPTAEANGHTHVLALLTRSGAMQPRPSAFDRYFVGPGLRRLSPDLARRYLERAEPYAALVEQMQRGTGPAGRAAVLPLKIDKLRISKLERRDEVLQEGARRGRQAVLDALG